MNTQDSFSSLGLAPSILRAVAEAGYTTPTPIQAQAIPQVLAGGDLLAAAQTGTGKTAGFTLPILHLLHTTPAPGKAAPGRPRCLILTPTRELAAQVKESVDTYGKYTPLQAMVMFGGVNINPQIQALRKPLDILVATPGRLLDHAGQRTVDLSGVEILVLDEADRMLDMGFIRDIRKVLALLPRKKQSLLFSATFSDEIRALAQGLLNQPGEVEVAKRNTTSELVSQAVYQVPQKQKRELLAHLLKRNDWRQVLVFTRTKHGANRLSEYLGKQGIAAAAIHGNKSQSARTRALSEFKDGSLPVLVATDIAARGLDIEQLPHVVNFELPNVAEDYVHRIGRTGRAGSTGHAISLVDKEELKLLTAIERLTRQRIEQLTEDSFVPSTTAAESYDEDLARPPRPPHNGSRHGNGARRPAPRDGNAAGRTPKKAADDHARPSTPRNAAAAPGKPPRARPQAALLARKSPAGRGH
ncbi:MAG: DEAD/DEAH box helicase [Rhodocyclaceae bacterium]|jgi:ATP-dependent RNA helicase RhlE|nr:DEAD/DEAH box helicase [Rhodocyclaceae bacterium]